MASPTILTDDNFSAEVKQYKGVVLVDFYADWCPSCRQMGPVVDELANDFAGRAKIAKVNVDAAQSVAGEFAVRSIPSFIVFKDGAKVDSVVGGVPKQDLTSRLDKVLGG